MNFNKSLLLTIQHVPWTKQKCTLVLLTIKNQNQRSIFSTIWRKVQIYRQIEFGAEAAN
jgi:hypothetical protein